MQIEKDKSFIEGKMLIPSILIGTGIMSLFLGIAEGWGTLSLVTGGAIAFGIKILDALRQLGQNKPQ